MTATTAPEHATQPLVSRPGFILAVVSTAHAVTHVYAALFPLIYPIIQREWLIPYGTLSAMIGFTQFFGGLLQLVFGFVGKYFPRNVVLGLGNLLFGIATGLSGLTTTFWQFALCRGLAAIGNAPQHPVGNSIVADSFPKERRGSALGINFAGGNIGTLIVPGIAVLLLGAVGWQQTLLYFAIPGIVVGLLLIFAMGDPTHATAAATAEPATRTSWFVQVKDVLRSPNVKLLIGASSIGAGGRGLGVVLTFIPLFLINGLGYAPELVGVLYTIMLIGSVVGPVLAARLSDRMGRRAILLASFLLSALTTVIFLLVVGEATPLPITAVLLFFMGAFVFIESPVIQSYMADTVPAGQRDVLFGFYFAWVYAVGALWVFAIGAAIDWGGFGLAWTITSLSYLGAAVCIFVSREEAASQAAH
jgi:MFS family permease